MLPLFSYASVVLGLISTLLGGFAWYRGMVRKRYAAERDFEHLRRSFEGLSGAIASQSRDIEEELDRLHRRLDTMNATQTEVKVFLMAKLGEATLGRHG